MKKRVLTVGKIAISVALLAVLFSRIDLGVLMAQYAGIELNLIALAMGLLLVQSALSTLKWKTILRADDADVPFPFLWKTYLIGNFLSLFLPSSIGGDFYRIYAVKDASQTLGKSTSSVLFDRISGVFALISIAFISSIFLPGNPYNGLTLALYGLLILVFILGTSDFAIARLQRLNLKSKWLRFPLKILQSFNAYRKDVPRLLQVILISFIFQFNLVVINKIYTLALGIDIPFRELLLIIPLIYLTEALPISINGLGVRESAFVFFFVLIGRTREEGLAVSLMIIFIRYLMGTIGGTLLLFDSFKPRRSVPEQPPSDPTSLPTPGS